MKISAKSLFWFLMFLPVAIVGDIPFQLTKLEFFLRKPSLERKVTALEKNSGLEYRSLVMAEFNEDFKQAVFSSLNPLVDFVFYTHEDGLIYTDKYQSEGRKVVRPQSNWAIVREHHILLVLLGIEGL